jgi:hypothetical protein
MVCQQQNCGLAHKNRKTPQRRLFDAEAVQATAWNELAKRGLETEKDSYS